MEHIDSNKTAQDLVYLVSCAVNQEIPDQKRCDGMDLPEVFNLAKRHMLSSVSSYALRHVMPLPDYWKEATAKAMRKQILFNSERKAVLHALEENGIWYLPLKGIVLKDYYPNPLMREMSDNDILIDKAKAQDVRSIMTGLGYSCTSYEKHHHDVYIKSVLSFEMHRQLFSRYDYPVLFDYYEKIESIMKRDADSHFGCHFSPEDLYIHIVSHMYKHFAKAGTGLRSLLDIYVYNRAIGDSLDRDYIASQLKKTDLVAFEQNNRQLAERVFSHQELSEDETRQLMYYIDSDCYGNIENQVMNELSVSDKRNSKMHYLLRRVFPSADFLGLYYPTVYRHRILYPFLVLYRPFKGIVTKRKRIVKELKAVKRFEKSEIKKEL